ATASFNVSNTLQVIFITPDQDQAIDVRPGKEFRIRVVVTGPRGGLVSTGKFTASCNTCDNGSKITKGMTGKGSGQYVVNFTAPTSTGNTALQVSGFESFSSGSQFLTIQVGTPSNNTGGAGPGGGGFGGGGGQPRLTITKLSPVFELPAGTETANLSVRTNRNATCRYAGREIPNPSFETANAFSITGARIHTVILNVSSGTGYPITVFCRSANLNASAEVFFSVQEEEVTTFQLDVPNRIEPITQGTTGTGSFTIFNNGTRRISIRIESDTSCCDTWIENNGVRTTNVTVPAGSETRLTLFVDVPLNTSLGVKTIDLSFSSAEIRREKTVNVEITKSPYIERLEELRRIADRLKKNITDYRQSGIQTEQLEQQLQELQRRLEFARTAIRNDDRRVLKKQVDRAEEIAANIRGQLRAKAFKHFVLTNWWKWVLEFIAAYITFFLVTMVFIPYYRLRSEYLNTQEQLDNAIEARKKAEKQYFKRQIDRDTFMNIMTEQQDEILELRSRRDELEEELATAIRDRLTIGNFLAAPVRAFREIARWWQSRRQMKEESEE
ncbi:MAG: hypothetical protein SVU32_00005, partial [Candidatus Nanohaloarchaea archaeon]|nr:hypothetical protein [Candidatus Nanohaloarchaea archaeon]